MDKVVGTFDPNTGEIRDLNGNVVTGTVTVNGTELNTAILADAVWQGCNHMVQEASEPETSVERRAFLLERVKTTLTYHYLILGFDEKEAAEQAENYLSKVK
ncbi:hypothetical protein [Bacteroides salyersiae]|mgnify:CR=1 FL=1|jgi:hypothetical protein|uniref:hypothetical protein n=2 Tax=Bacteroides TaxID=816 RepID=UPI00216603F5|nr:hypothetical protein [Bacteroides salyersiae]MCS3060310.1 hypothetical protein [Bacteroides salyersiae]